MTYLITGGCGFLGSNIAKDILDNSNDELIVFDNLYRKGSNLNLDFLKESGRDFTFIHGDIRNFYDISKVIIDFKPDIVYHLSGQVAMTTSIANPRFDFEVNAVGTFNILDSIRQFSKDSIVIYSSTNKVYGDLENFTYKETAKRYICEEYPYGFSEDIGIDLHSPYGCSKGIGDMYMLDFHRIYGVKSIVFRHSSMYGVRQFSTYDQGWIGYFINEAINNNEITISGNGKQVRDILYASDMVRLYLDAPKYIEKMQGNAFNIGGGWDNSLSILELFDILEEILDIKIKYHIASPRASDQKIFVANLDKLNRIMPFNPTINKQSGIKKMIEWVKSNN